jgi:hypothetical protein
VDVLDVVIGMLDRRRQPFEDDAQTHGEHAQCRRRDWHVAVQTADPFIVRHWLLR